MEIVKTPISEDTLFSKECVEGQLISKFHFGIFNSSKNRMKKFDLTTILWHLQVELFSFVFLEELKTPKRHFEINWRLHIFQSDIFLIISNYHYSDKLKKTGLKNHSILAFYKHYCYFIMLVFITLGLAKPMLRAQITLTVLTLIRKILSLINSMLTVCKFNPNTINYCLLIAVIKWVSAMNHLMTRREILQVKKKEFC